MKLLIKKELWHLKSYLLPAMIAITIAFILQISFMALFNGIHHTIIPLFLEETPLDMIEIVPPKRKTLLQNIFSFGQDEKRYSISAVQRQAIRTHSSVITMYEKMDIDLPLGASGGSQFFRDRLYSDIFAIGVSPQLIQKDLPTGLPFEDNPAGVIPVIISPLLLDMFNEAVGPALGVPRLTPELLRGFEFDVIIGKSYMLGQKGTVGKERCRVVGVSNKGLTLGITVPLSTAIRWQQQYGQTQEYIYSSVFVKLKKLDDVLPFKLFIEQLGLGFSEAGNRFRNVMAIVYILESILNLLFIVVSIVIILQVLQLILNQRKKVYAIFISLGFSTTKIWILISSIMTSIIIVSGMCGYLVYFIVQMLVNYFVRNIFGSLAIVREGLFVMDGSVVVKVVLASLILLLLIYFIGFMIIRKFDYVSVIEGKV